MEIETEVTLSQLNDLQQQKLWHQLTVALDRYISQNTDNLYDFCTSFIFPISSYLNQLTFVDLCLKISKTMTDPKLRCDFLQELHSRLSEKEENPFLVSMIALARAKLLLGEVAECQNMLERVQELMSKTSSDDRVQSIYFITLAEAKKAEGDLMGFYTNGLMHLSFTDLDALAPVEQEDLAFELGLAAILAKDVFSFGELIAHPIFERLTASPRAWIAELLTVLNAGDLSGYEVAVAAHQQAMQTQPALVQNASTLADKIRILAFTNLIFSMPADQRVVPFGLIAETSHVSEDAVEHLVMRALALGLIRGRIDQVARVVRVEWVQPRVLTLPQVEQLRAKMQQWRDKVSAGLLFLQSQTTDLLPQ
eukprot:gnl/Trimastix_PCT/1217.p1 GENE.gnl/Trimastix_PCT/1217~~gnl/Trimastix_PCT/1217.p1  ORF type:complete len:373 (-),score=117.32 gnl/Trimastix_PCT/1217:9-1106(-)